MKKKNLWKIAFLSLLTCLGVIATVLIILVYTNVPEANDSIESDRKNRSGEKRFVISTTKDDLNEFVREQLDRSNNENFTVYIDDYVTFEVVIPVFGTNILLSIDLEPELYGEGNLLLKERAFRLGNLKLPSETAIQLIKNHIEFPDWIVIDAREGLIYLYVTEIDILETLFIKITAFDLKEDNIEIQLVH